MVSRSLLAMCLRSRSRWIVPAKVVPVKRKMKLTLRRRLRAKKYRLNESSVLEVRLKKIGGTRDSQDPKF